MRLRLSKTFSDYRASMEITTMIPEVALIVLRDVKQFKILKKLDNHVVKLERSMLLSRNVS